MIDTIVLTLKRNMFTIKQPDRFSPSAGALLNAGYRLGGRANMSCYQNPTHLELESGIYKPRLTLTGRINRNHNFEVTLRIELSLPKLVFGNNFDELEDDDFYDTVILLGRKLDNMGVEVSEFNLATAPVSAIHYPKNVPLTDGSIPYSYLKEIQKSNITQRLDFNQTDFRNEGHSVKFRANSFEVAFYDKLKDLQKSKISEKRAEENDNAIQTGLFETLSTRKPFELLRMEVRLNKMQKIKQVLKIIGSKVNPSFHNLFNTKIAKKVLLYHLDQIETGYPKLLYFKPKSSKDFIAQFVIDNSKANIKDPFTALGLQSCIKDIGTREVRELLKKYPKSSWYSFIERMNGFLYSKSATSPFEPIRNAINEFIPVKLIDFQDKMIYNDKYKSL